MDDKIIELTRRVEAEINPVELDRIVQKHAKPWEYQTRTFWDRIRFIGISISAGVALTIVIISSPIIPNQTGTAPTTIVPIGTEVPVGNEKPSDNGTSESVDNGNNGNINEGNGAQPTKPQSQEKQQLLANVNLALSLIDETLAQPADDFELGELD